MASRTTVAEVAARTDKLETSVSKLTNRINALEKSVRDITDNEDVVISKIYDKVTDKVVAVSVDIEKNILERVDGMREILMKSLETTTQSVEVPIDLQPAQQDVVPTPTPTPTPVVMPKFSRGGHAETTAAKSWKDYITTERLFVAVAILILLVLIVQPNCNTGGIIGPKPDVNTPLGLATQEVSQEPFRSDAAGRKAFGEVIDGALGYVDSETAGGNKPTQLGWSNVFSKRLHEKFPESSRHTAYAELAERLDKVCLSYNGAGSNDAKYFDNWRSVRKVFGDSSSRVRYDFEYTREYARNYSLTP